MPGQIRIDSGHPGSAPDFDVGKFCERLDAMCGDADRTGIRRMRGGSAFDVAQCKENA